MNYKTPKIRKPRKSGPQAMYGEKVVLNKDFAGWYVHFGDDTATEMIYYRPAQIRRLAKWLNDCADFIQSQEGKK